LKLALERLLGAPCYHMAEVFKRPQDIPIWHAAAKGEPVDWRALFADYVAAVDWPPAGFWPQLAEVFPDAIILLSVRDADAWWKSASNTIFAAYQAGLRSNANPGWSEMITAMFTNTFTPGFLDAETAKAAFDRHNADVRKRAPANRLVEWRVTEGWGPLCAALGVPVPDEPFPVSNTSEEFRARTHLDG
jgi:Sulfotransferase domain